MQKQKLKIGVAETVITPLQKDVFLVGPIKFGEGIHDDLFCRVLWIDDDCRPVVIVTLDLVGLDFKLAEEIGAEIEKRTGIGRERIMLNCSHTHNAPVTVPWYTAAFKSFEEGMKKWRVELIKKIVNTVRSAHANIQEAKLFYGREPVQIGFNRRLPTKDGIVMKPNPRGVVVPWVDVLRADSLDNKPIAVLFSHAAHPVIVHGASAMISADYPGFAVKTVRHNIGKNAVVMFAQGCGANINGEPLRGGFAEAEKAGKKLGTAAVAGFKKSRPISGCGLRAYTLELQLPFQKYPRPAACKKAIKTWEAEYEAQKGKNWYLRNIILALRELLKMARKGGKKCLKFKIQAFAFGDKFCVVGLTHEIFAEYQLWVNKISPFKYNMIFGYTNGCESYIPCKKDFTLGGYEAGSVPFPCAPLAYRNRLTLKPQVEKQIKSRLKKVFQRLMKREI